MGTKYRYRNGDVVSGWLLVDALREAVRSKVVLAGSHIQQAGSESWVLASTVPGLIAAEPAVDAAASNGDGSASRAEQRAGQRPPETIHHLLHRSIRTTVQMCAHDSGHKNPLTGMIIGLTADGFMIEFADPAAIAYFPLTRIRAVTISARFPVNGSPRGGEGLLIDVDSLPDISALATSE